jgi:hypothetical protein
VSIAIITKGLLKYSKYSVLTISLALLFIATYTFTWSSVEALDNDFSNGITVDSTGDNADSNAGDNVCDDGSGNCTLRAAIIESNATAGTQTIRFNITGTADFSSNGQDGYTIQPQSALPNITDTVIIDGYTQPGAQANTALAPNPLNGTLLIEIDGSGAGNVNGLIIDDDNSILRGLIINNFSNTDMSAISVGGDDLSIQGNYIGTNRAGNASAPNYCGICQGADNSTGTLVGGLDPEDRNILSGNSSTGSSPNTGSDNWVYQGNYIGIAKDGLTPLPNAQAGGSGAISLDNSDGHLVGGPEATATNVISGNNSIGVAPNSSKDVIIENNYIGVGFDGVTAIGNGGSGINYSTGSTDSQTTNNIIGHNENNGISYTSGSDNGTVTGNTIFESASGGIGILSSSSIVIGGTANTDSNSFTRNTGSHIAIVEFGGSADSITIQGNTFENNLANPGGFAAGISIMASVSNTLIGGAQPNAGNVFIDTTGSAVSVSTLEVTAIPVTAVPDNISVLGNSIYGSSPAPVVGVETGLGIDLLHQIDSSPTPDGIPETITNDGPTLNDVADSDTGPNNYMNFPVINSAEQNELGLNLNIDLDAADSPTGQYRVELFANDEADASGYGEGQSLLGYINMDPGNNQNVSINLPTGTDLSGKTLSATTTAIDNTTDSGFGATSEFSLASNVTVVAPSQSDVEPSENLAKTGQNIQQLTLLGLVCLVTGLAIMWSTRKFAYTARN